MEISSPAGRTAELVAALLEARRSGRAVAPEALAGPDPTREEAYGIQAGVARAIGEVGGYKVANKPGAARIMAPIFRKDILEAPATLAVGAREEIGIELEIGFRIEAPLPARGVPERRAAIAACLSALPVIEIVRTRLPPEASAELKLADNQINGGLVLGAPVRDWHDLPLGEVEAVLDLGSDRVLEGAARVPGGDAFENFLVLEGMVGGHCGGLRPGQIVITGSLNGLPYVRGGIGVAGRIAGLGEVSLGLVATA